MTVRTLLRRARWRARYGRADTPTRRIARAFDVPPHLIER